MAIVSAACVTDRPRRDIRGGWLRPRIHGNVARQGAEAATAMKSRRVNLLGTADGGRVSCMATDVSLARFLDPRSQSLARSPSDA